jgi:hypothetical protein
MFFVNNITPIDNYAPEKFLEDISEGCFLTLNSTFVTEMKALPLKSYVTSKEERPELIAYNIYGDTQFTWIIMLYNSCTDFTDGTFAAGTAIKFPSIEALEKIIFTLKARQRAWMSETGG